MPLFVPTPREIVLLAFLLVGLLTLSTTIQPSKLSVSDLTKLRSSFYTYEDDTPPPPATFESQYALQALNVPPNWGLGKVPQTQIVAHVPGASSFCCLLSLGIERRNLTGWTIFDKLYFSNGTFYVVTDNPESYPDRKFMISSGVFIENGPIAEARRQPGDKDMQIIDTDTARQLFGSQAERLDGVSVSCVEFRMV